MAHQGKEKKRIQNFSERGQGKERGREREKKKRGEDTEGFYPQKHAPSWVEPQV